MARYEVHIPAGEHGGFNVTFKVDADNWMAALKTGMQKLGEQGASVQNVLVDIQEDNSIHVTESRTGRVFRIRELSDEEAAQARPKQVADDTRGVPNPLSQGPGDPLRESLPRAPARPLDPRARPPTLDTAKTLLDLPAVSEERPQTGAPPLEAEVPNTTVDRPRGLSAGNKKSSPKFKPHDPDEVIELEKPTHPVKGSIGRSRPPAREQAPVASVEDTLSEVFERVQDIYSRPSIEDALYFLLDLALEKIPAEAGTVYRADAGSGNLAFAAVRGPKAQELLRSGMVIPAGTGIAGFCAIEGVAVAVSDVEKDPRFYRAVSAKLKYETRSILCAPMMTHGRTFGCFQLVNKRGGNVFADHEVGLLSYIAHQAALYLNARV